MRLGAQLHLRVELHAPLGTMASLLGGAPGIANRTGSDGRPRTGGSIHFDCSNRSGLGSFWPRKGRSPKQTQPYQDPSKVLGQVSILILLLLLVRHLFLVAMHLFLEIEVTEAPEFFFAPEVPSPSPRPASDPPLHPRVPRGVAPPPGVPRRTGRAPGARLQPAALADGTYRYRGDGSGAFLAVGRRTWRRSIRWHRVVIWRGAWRIRSFSLYLYEGF